MRGGQNAKNNEVPKFASFRPRQKPPNVHDVKDVNQGKDSSSANLQQQSIIEAPASQSRYSDPKLDEVHSPIRSHPDEPSHRTQLRSRSRERDGQRSSKSKSRGREVIKWANGHDLFQIDKRGDEHNLVYGTLHRYSIPGYYRVGAGSVIGLSKTSKIERNVAEEGIVIVRTSRPIQPRKREKYSFARNERRPMKKLRIRRVEHDSTPEGVEEFIPIREAKGHKRTRMEDVDMLSSNDEDDNHYRSLQGKAKIMVPPLDNDLEYDSNSSQSDYEAFNLDSLSATTRQQLAELSRKVELDPTNVDAWLNLIKHQDAVLGLSGSGSRHKITNAERRSTVDIKLSMYEKAIEKVGPAKVNRERLLNDMMEEGSRIWDYKTQVMKWQSVLRENPDSTGLWTKYLNFQQTNFQTFHSEQHRNMYLECIQMVKAAILRTKDNSPETQDLERAFIYLTLRFTLFLREAGFTEIACAVWQGLFELNFFAPKELFPLGKPVNNYLTHFEEFWDSEVGRIGEVASDKWDKYFQQNKHFDVPKPANVATTPSSEDNVLKNWATLEKHKSLSARIPARSLDDLDNEDPYRVVLFADIKELMIILSAPHSKHHLVNAFLSFCRLPMLNLSSHAHEEYQWRGDSFIRTDALEQSDASVHGLLGGNADARIEVRARSLSDPDSDYNRPPGPLTFSFHSFIPSIETLFGNKESWFAAFECWNDTYPHDTGPVPFAWLRAILKDLVFSSAGNSELAQLYLAFEWRNNSESWRKRVKLVLARYSSSLRLYTAYALAERRLGKHSRADDVFSNALKSCGTLSENDQLDRTLIWRIWVWEILQDGDVQGAYQKLLDIVRGHSAELGVDVSDSGVTDIPQAPTTALLRAKQALRLGLEASISQFLPSQVLDYTDLIALLAYVSHDRALDDALDVYKTSYNLLKDRPGNTAMLRELLHQSQARLLYVHATTSSSFRPALIRSQLAESIKLFPQNTIFLSLYAWNERRLRIDDRVRSIMREVVLKEHEETVVGWVFSIWNEAKGTIGGGHNIHSVKATFERAVASNSGKSSPTIWKLYVLFSLAHFSHDHTTSVFYRAVRACPWVKQLFMLAFTHLHYLDDQELRRIYEVMREKELRIHVDLDEMLDGAKESTTGNGPGPIELPSDAESRNGDA